MAASQVNKQVSQEKSVGQSLEDYIAAAAVGAGLTKSAGSTIIALAAAASRISGLVARGPLSGMLGAETGSANADGDEQKALDIRANEIVLDVLSGTSTAYFASEEEDAILTLDADGDVAVAVDPLDGSSNIDVNLSIGTIFSIFPVADDGATASFFRPASDQVAAGYFIYGPHTALVLTLGDGVDVFVLDPEERVFLLVQSGVAIAANTNEFAINASNYRHWFEPVKTFIDDCLAGIDGPRSKNFNMRWIASLVAEAHRIFSRGGVFLYPADRRAGYEHGRLRLLYEAAPIAFLVEQAGGNASDGHMRILDKMPASLHERTPLVFGSSVKVSRVESYHVNPDFERAGSPLFGERGLFRP